MSDRETVEFLAGVPLLAGRGEADLVELARLVRRRTVPEGQYLWRQGDRARELVFIVDGVVSKLLDVTGDRTAELGRSGPRDVVGEIGLLDGQGHAMSMRVAETATVLALGRQDFAALLAGQHPSAFRLKRQLAVLLTARLRAQLEHLAESLGGRPSPEPPASPAELEECKAPDSRYVRRMTTFHDFDPLALWGFLTSGRYVWCPPGRVLLAEGTPSTAFYLTINGAVEKVLVRGDRRIRIGLAGPGKAFGYESLLDGLPSPVTAITRERACLLVIPHDLFGRLFEGEDAVSRGFLDVIQRDLMTALRETLRPRARQAASAPPPTGDR
jgi:CRP-like cAMP-binding protein